MSWRFQLLSRPYGGVTEGPVWDGEVIYFTHIPTSRIMQYDPRADAISEARGNTNHTNGLAYDLPGRLYGCCSGGRSIVRFDPDGSTATIADGFSVVRGGQESHVKLNTPNDLAIDRLGRIWFTNPWNVGNIDPSEVEEPGLRWMFVATPQPDGHYNVTVAAQDTTMPNGILVSPDQKTCTWPKATATEWTWIGSCGPTPSTTMAPSDRIVRCTPSARAGTRCIGALMVCAWTLKVTLSPRPAGSWAALAQ